MLLTPLLAFLPLLEAKHVEKVSPAALKEYTLAADGITASFIPFGARLKSLRVPDAGGAWREVNLGYADAQGYADEAAPSYYGAVIGRYANRIRNGTFTVDGVTSRIATNEHDGKNTLHGGRVGYDAREWSVLSANSSSVTFSLMDYGFEGFPGNVLALAQYSLSAGKLTTVLTAHALDRPTPILLTTHSYFNLGSDVSSTVLQDTLHVKASRVVGVDGILVPTGQLDYVAGTNGNERHPLNFTAPSAVSQALPAGLDHCFLFDRPSPLEVTEQLEWRSAATGIRMRVRTNQPAIQVYSCSMSDGSASTQLGKVERFGCMAIEPQGWIDGISHPEWLQNQVYSPGSAPFVNVAEYVFDTVEMGAGPSAVREETARDEL
ncbi:galactose mutarotase-like protein [Cutaneotrichosporon oleaginosum]|uniref:Galactose mutarotase-like protein n=1 Tax=Cutaneotrichosporon oleaginosum TaxID=879819 RepID=A0A0J0XMI4_9TREE|nr:galactose mutarotase-like protein [Cutaneotrichosporon oleaginosum]KLT42283.1 galactose mutarotase-like protein [Cutaneotrichosporon oleaginosum]TXT11455.1 hypothetical protein COLE_01865 [Cutaneotrichosporon oleaginosum]